MESVLSDSGERIQYGDGMAIREPCAGKGRYELISPYALRRLALHCENGATKYSSSYEIEIDQVLPLLKRVCLNDYNMKIEITEDNNGEYEGTCCDKDGEVDFRVAASDLNSFCIVCIQCLKAHHISFPVSYTRKADGSVSFVFDYDGGRNWEKGMPYSRYLDSAMRHLQQVLMGMTNEDHLAAAAWNIFAIMHHQEMGEDRLDDLPHYDDRRGVPC